MMIITLHGFYLARSGLNSLARFAGPSESRDWQSVKFYGGNNGNIGG